MADFPLPPFSPDASLDPATMDQLRAFQAANELNQAAANAAPPGAHAAPPPPGLPVPGQGLAAGSLLGANPSPATARVAAGGDPDAPTVGWSGGPLPAPDAFAAPTGPRGSLEEAMYLVNRSAGQESGMGPTQLAALAKQRKLDAENVALQRSMADRTRTAASAQETAANETAVEVDLAGQRAEDIANQLEREEAERRERLTKLDGEIDRARTQWQDATKNLNPHRLMGKSGNIALFALSNAFQSAGSILTRGRTQNVAVQQMDAAIERDFEAQQVRARGLQDNTNMLLAVRDRLVAAGADERAARVASRAMAYEQLGNYLKGQALRADGADRKLQLENAADAMLMKANEDQAAAYALLAKPVKRAPTDLERTQDALKLRQEMLKTQKMEQDLTGGDPATKEAAITRRSKLAGEFRGINSSVKSLEGALALMDGPDGVGTFSASSPDIVGGLRDVGGGNAQRNADLFRQRLLAAVTEAAAARGGPITESDMKWVQEQLDVSKGAWRDSTMRMRLENVLTFLREKQDNWMAGQNQADIDAIQGSIQANTPARADQYRKRFVNPE